MFVETAASASSFVDESLAATAERPLGDLPVTDRLGHFTDSPKIPPVLPVVSAAHLIDNQVPRETLVPVGAITLSAIDCVLFHLAKFYRTPLHFAGLVMPL